jgi:hypothetical protein
LGRPGAARDVAAPCPQLDWPLYWHVARDMETGPAEVGPEVAGYRYAGGGTAKYVKGGIKDLLSGSDA